MQADLSDIVIKYSKLLFNPQRLVGFLCSPYFTRPGLIKEFAVNQPRSMELFKRQVGCRGGGEGLAIERK